MIRALALPGMDGTGELLSDFVAELAPEITAETVIYPADRALGYDALSRIAEDALPEHGKCLLLAESFSGPVALRLAQARPDRLLGVVLAASFAKAPRTPWLPIASASLGRIASHLPARQIPRALLAFFMMGRWATRGYRNRLDKALHAVDPQVIRRRILDATRVDALALLRDLSVPLLYLRATHDRMISDASWKTVKATLPRTALAEIEGPHCLFLTRPDVCAQAIKRWARETIG
jgi:pimeloyl-[acyl-carrier protein] methyl ester esterase